MEERPEDPDVWLMMAYTVDSRIAAKLYLEKAAERGAPHASLNEVKRRLDDRFEYRANEKKMTFSKRNYREHLSWKKHTPQLAALAYLILLTIAEGLISLGYPHWGMALHGVCLVSLIVHSSLKNKRRQRSFLLSLSFTPLIRLLSLTLPLAEFPQVYWYAVVGAPLIIAGFFLMRLIGISGDQVGISLKGFKFQLPIALLGILLGWVEYLILRPEPLISEFRLDQFLLPALILLIFTGFLEEFFFRGILQHNSRLYLGKWGIVYISLLFAVFHLGYNSVLDVLFVFAVALVFGYLAQKTGSILGVTLAHGLTNIFLYLVFPFILMPGLNPVHITQTAPPEHTGAVLVYSTADYKEITTVPIQPETVSGMESDSGTPVDSSLTPPVIAISSTQLPEETQTQQPTGLAAAAGTPEPTPKYTPEISADPDPILVDDGDPGFVRNGGNWWNVPQGFNGDLVWAFASYGRPTISVEWHPEIVKCGKYEVKVFIPFDYGSVSEIIYCIDTSYGISRVAVNQILNQGEWVSLGEFWFDSEGSNIIMTSNQVTNPFEHNMIAAYDAIMLNYIESCHL